MLLMLCYWTLPAESYPENCVYLASTSPSLNNNKTDCEPTLQVSISILTGAGQTH